MTTPRVLMCPPDFFSVDYVINPWMDGNVHAASQTAARRQWDELFARVSERAEVSLLPAQPGVPDLVFTANAATVRGRTALLASFRHPERQAEEPVDRAWFEANGYDVRALPRTVAFEGAGDALFDRARDVLYFGHGHRSDANVAGLLGEVFGVDVLPLALADPRFYHLDTCLCPLEGGFVMYYPEAFRPEARRAIEHAVPRERRIVVAEQDALDFACNAVNLGRRVILNRASTGLREVLEERGFEVVEVRLSEFMKAGGSAKCLTLRLDEEAPVALALSERVR